MPVAVAHHETIQGKRYFFGVVSLSNFFNHLEKKNQPCSST